MERITIITSVLLHYRLLEPKGPLLIVLFNFFISEEKNWASLLISESKITQVTLKKTPRPDPMPLVFKEC